MTRPASIPAEDVGRGAFRCAMCDAVIYDSLYRGPWGHAPARLCLECWLGQWEQMVQRMQAGGDWTGIDAALSLLCAGYSLRQTAGILGRARKTLVRSLRRALHSFEALPEWFVLRLERRSGEVRDVR